jgi:urocanate hydratase
VMARAPLDSAPLASPLQESESTNDASHAPPGWPPLSALLDAASGASWLSIRGSVGVVGVSVGMGGPRRAMQVTVADGTGEMARRIERVLSNDPDVKIPLEGV